MRLDRDEFGRLYNSFHQEDAIQPSPMLPSSLDQHDVVTSNLDSAASRFEDSMTAAVMVPARTVPLSQGTPTVLLHTLRAHSIHLSWIQLVEISVVPTCCCWCTYRCRVLCLSHSQAEFGSSQSDSRVWQVPLALESGEQVEQVAGAVRSAAAKHWKLMRNALSGNTAFVGA